MNGPFEVSRHTLVDVLDNDGRIVAEGSGDRDDDHEQTANAQMVCDALNAVFYIQQATRSTSE